LVSVASSSAMARARRRDRHWKTSRRHVGLVVANRPRHQRPHFRVAISAATEGRLAAEQNQRAAILDITDQSLLLRVGELARAERAEDHAIVALQHIVVRRKAL